MGYYDGTVCIICGNLMYRTASKNYRSIKNIRAKTALTCCKECSKIYNHLPNKIRKQVKEKYLSNKKVFAINPETFELCRNNAGLSSPLIINESIKVMV